MVFRIAEHAKMESVKSGMSKSLKFVASSVDQYRCISKTKSRIASCGKVPELWKASIYAGLRDSSCWK